jgi:Prolipoprotein diacylglyceryl transferase
VSGGRAEVAQARFDLFLIGWPLRRGPAGCEIPVSMELAQPGCLCAAFWVALWAARRHPAHAGGPGGAGCAGEETARVVWGLVLAGLLAHAGWLGLHASVAGAAAPAATVFPLRGFSLLFVPLGPLLVAPWGCGLRAALRQLAPVCAALPLALAVARLGCLAAGCCLGRPVGTGPWSAFMAWDGLHPVRLYEIAGWLALAGALPRLPQSRVAPAFLIAFGALRLLLEPLRAPVVPAAWPAPLCLGAGWVAFGAGLLLWAGGLPGLRGSGAVGGAAAGRR